MPTDGKINIYITEGDLPDDAGGSSGGGDKGPQKGGKSKKDPLERYLEHEALHLIKKTVSQMISFSVNQIGNLTGDYGLQRDVENAVNIGRQMMSVGVAALAGFKASKHPIGAVIGAGIAITSNIFTGLVNIHTLSVENKKQNYDIAQIRSRSGMNDLNDGNRGTLD